MKDHIYHKDDLIRFGLKVADVDMPDSEWYLVKDGIALPIDEAGLLEYRYGREFSPAEIERCESRERYLHEQIQQYKADGVKVVRMVIQEGRGKDYEEMNGFCFYVRDLSNKKYLTVHPFASNEYEPCDSEDCDCSRFIWKPKSWF